MLAAQTRLATMDGWKLRKSLLFYDVDLVGGAPAKRILLVHLQLATAFLIGIEAYTRQLVVLGGAANATSSQVSSSSPLRRVQVIDSVGRRHTEASD